MTSNYHICSLESIRKISVSQLLKAKRIRSLLRYGRSSWLVYPAPYCLLALYSEVLVFSVTLSLRESKACSEFTKYHRVTSSFVKKEIISWVSRSHPAENVGKYSDVAVKKNFHFLLENGRDFCYVKKGFFWGMLCKVFLRQRLDIYIFK